MFKHFTINNEFINQVRDHGNLKALSWTQSNSTPTLYLLIKALTAQPTP